MLVYAQLCLIGFYMSFLFQSIVNFDSSCNASELWQFRIIAAIISKRKSIAESDMLVSQDMLQSMVDRVKLRMEDILKDSGHLIRSYVVGVTAERSLVDLLSELCNEGRMRIARLLTFYDLPIRILSSDVLDRISQTDYLQFVCGMQEQYPELSTSTVCHMAEALGLKSVLEKI